MAAGSRNTRRAWGEGSLHQRADGRWQAQVSVSKGGKRQRRSATFDTKFEAAQAVRSMRAELEAVDPVTGRATVADAVEGYERHLAARVAGGTLRETTAHWYGVMLRSVPEDLRAKRLEDVTAADIEGWTSTLGGSRSAVRGAFVAFRSAWRIAMRDRLTGNDPFARVKPPQPGRMKEPKFASKEDVDALVATAEPPYAQWFRILADTGLRRSEFLGLVWADVADGALLVRHGKTASARRWVPLTKAAQQALDELPRGGPADPVCTVTGQKLADTMKSLAGFTPHALRHGLATRLLDAGTSPHTVAGILGHSSPVVTLNAYSHLVSSEKRRALEALEQ